MPLKSYLDHFDSILHTAQRTLYKTPSSGEIVNYAPLAVDLFFISRLFYSYSYDRVTLQNVDTTSVMSACKLQEMLCTFIIFYLRLEPPLNPRPSEPFRTGVT
jgi:hypothetical protein